MNDHNMNDNLDNELKSALGRREAPPDFAAKVMARAAQQPRATSGFSSVSLRALCGKAFSFPSRSPMRLATAAVLAIALIAAGIHYRNVQKEQAQGEAAKQRLLLALHIAGNKLQLARTKVQQLNDDGTDSRQQQEQE